MVNKITLISVVVLLISLYSAVYANDYCDMGSVAPPNNALPSACMMNVDGCNFLGGHHEANGRCVEAGYICCVFRCEGDPECD